MNDRHRTALEMPTTAPDQAKDDRFLRVVPARHPITGRLVYVGTVLTVGRWPDVFGGAPSWYVVAALRGEEADLDDLSPRLTAMLRVAALVEVQGVGEGEMRRDQGRRGVHVFRKLSPAEAEALPPWFSEVPVRKEPAGPRDPWS